MFVFSIRANFKTDFIYFPVHRTPLSRLSQWLTILSQQLHLCHLDIGGNDFGHKCSCGQNIFNMNPVQGFAKIVVVRYVFQI